MLHLVFTRFAIRRLYTSTHSDPLNAANLRRRLVLMESLSAASVTGQSVDEFHWIVLVDPALPPEYRHRVAELAGRHPRGHVLEWGPAFDRGRLEWLATLPVAPTRWILTTLLDDDDALYSHFVRDVQRLAAGLAGAENRPLTLFGCHDVVQWDCVPTPAQPLGSTYEWRRALPTSAGFSALCDTRRLAWSVFDFGHHLAQRYSSGDAKDLSAAARQSLLDVRSGVADQVRAGGGTEADVEHVFAPGLYRPIESDGLQVVVSCHTGNERAARLFEGSARRTPVAGRETFTGVPVDLDAMVRGRAAVRATPGTLGRKLIQQYRIERSAAGTSGVGARLSAARGALQLARSWRRWSRARGAVPVERNGTSEENR